MNCLKMYVCVYWEWELLEYRGVGEYGDWLYNTDFGWIWMSWKGENITSTYTGHWKSGTPVSVSVPIEHWNIVVYCPTYVLLECILNGFLRMFMSGGLNTLLVCSDWTPRYHKGLWSTGDGDSGRAGSWEAHQCPQHALCPASSRGPLPHPRRLVWAQPSPGALSSQLPGLSWQSLDRPYCPEHKGKRLTSQHHFKWYFLLVLCVQFPLAKQTFKSSTYILEAFGNPFIEFSLKATKTVFPRVVSVCGSLLIEPWSILWSSCPPVFSVFVVNYVCKLLPFSSSASCFCDQEGHQAGCVPSGECSFDSRPRRGCLHLLCVQCLPFSCLTVQEDNHVRQICSQVQMCVGSDHPISACVHTVGVGGHS